MFDLYEHIRSSILEWDSLPPGQYLPRTNLSREQLNAARQQLVTLNNAYRQQLTLQSDYIDKGKKIGRRLRDKTETSRLVDHMVGVYTQANNAIGIINNRIDQIEREMNNRNNRNNRIDQYNEAVQQFLEEAMDPQGGNNRGSERQENTGEDQFNQNKIENIAKSLANTKNEEYLDIKEKIEAKIPEKFICPMSFVMIDDPVVVTTSVKYKTFKTIFDKPTIKKWLQMAKNNKHPISRAPIKSIDEDKNLKSEIDSFMNGLAEASRKGMEEVEEFLDKFDNDEKCDEIETSIKHKSGGFKM